MRFEQRLEEALERPALESIFRAIGLPQNLWDWAEKAWNWEPRVDGVPNNQHPHDSLKFIQGSKPIVLTYRHQLLEAQKQAGSTEQFEELLVAAATTSSDYDKYRTKTSDLTNKLNENCVFYRSKDVDIAKLAHWAIKTQKGNTPLPHFVLGMTLGYTMKDIKDWISKNITESEEFLRKLPNKF